MLQGLIGGYKRLQEGQRVLGGLQEIIGGCKDLQGVTKGYKGLKDITKGYRGLQ